MVPLLQILRVVLLSHQHASLRTRCRGEITFFPLFSLPLSSDDSSGSFRRMGYSKNPKWDLWEHNKFRQYYCRGNWNDLRTSQLNLIKGTAYRKGYVPIKWTEFDWSKWELFALPVKGYLEIFFVEWVTENEGTIYFCLKLGYVHTKTTYRLSSLLCFTTLYRT